jgi:hypothetical protein
MDEVPHRSVIDLEAALGELGNEPAQGKIFFLDPKKQPGAVLVRNCLRPMAAHLAGHNAAGFLEAPDLIDHRADPDGKMSCRLSPRHAALQNCRNNSLSQISRIWSSHPC